MEAIELGPFQLVEEVGEGTMGRVFRARHPASGEEVAVKAMTSELAREPRFRRRFRSEVQAMAQLTHPAVAAVYDLGQIDPPTARQSDGRLPEGSPWLAMEYVEGLSITELPESYGWHRLQWTLLEVLDALAHSHAVGVIHRDLKPANILVRDQSGEGLDVKIVDFGVARIVDPDAEADVGEREDRIAGTPKYMAPEQILGRRRDQGPWTDLYAVGCLAWSLTTGSPPFDGDEVDAIFESQLEAPLPEYRPRLGVPDGMEEWLRGMLATHPDRRFRRAADASHALRELTEDGGAAGPTVRRTSGTLAERRSTVDVALEETTIVEEPDDSMRPRDPYDAPVGRDDGDLEGGRGRRPAGEVDLPPVPEDWRQEDERERPNRQLRGAGVGLFGLRRVPVVDRERERSLLWEELRRVDAEGRPRLVLLRGPTGGGKQRVAGWMLRRAHAVGAAHVFSGFHSSRGTPGEGLAGMLARHFRCVGLEVDEAAGRIRRVYERCGADGPRANHELRSLARWFVRGAAAGFGSPQGRHETLAHLFEYLGRRRASVVRLEQVEHGPESLAFLRHLLEERPEEVPLLCVATLGRAAARGDRRGERLLEELRGREGVRELRIGPLEDDAQRELVEQMLGLEPSTAAEVVRRTEGHPTFAVQLLRDWVERDRLTMTDGGYALEETADVDVPDDIHKLWRQRVAESLDSVGAAGTERRAAGERALEMAAVFGPEVRSREWEALADRAGLEEPDRLLAAMYRQGLAERREDGWSFTHGLLRESLAQEAREAGRWREFQKAAANLLLELYEVAAPGVAKSVARHLEAAGELEAAVHYLSTAARQALAAAEHEEAHELIERQRELMDELDGPTGRFEARYLVLRGELAGRKGEPAGALEWAERAVERASDGEEAAELGHALRLRAEMARETGDLDGALADARRALETFEEGDDRAGRARAHHILGRIRQIAGELPESREHFRAARRLYDEIGDRSQVALMTCDLGYVAIMGDDRQVARDRLRESLEMGRSIGNQRVAAKSWNRLGEIERFENNWQEARRAYRRAQELFRVPRNRHVANLNLAFVELADGNYSQAESYFQLLEPSFESSGIHYPQVMLGQSCCDAANEAWDRWDRHVDAGVESLRGSGMAHPDLPWLAIQSGELALEAGEAGRAKRAFRIAAEQWRELGREERAESLEERRSIR